MPCVVAEVASPVAAEAAYHRRKHRPNLRTALHQKVINHHECTQAEVKVVTEDRQFMRLQVRKLQADMERDEKFVSDPWELVNSTPRRPHRHAGGS